MTEAKTDTVDQEPQREQHRRIPGPLTSEALSRLAYLLERPLGCGAVLGPTRSGKTAMLRALAAGCQQRGATTAIVDCQGLDGRGLHRELAGEWRIGPASEPHGRRLAQEIRDYLHGALAARMRLAIILDHTDRMEHSGAIALSRLLHEAELQRGLTLLWSATSPPSGDAAEVLQPFTELRIDCPAPTLREAAELAREHWERSAGPGETAFPAELTARFAELSGGDLRRAERLAQLSRLAALAEGAPLSSDMLDAVARELV